MNHDDLFGAQYARKADAFASTQHWRDEMLSLVLPRIGDSKSVLDVGCNTGRLLQLIADKCPGVQHLVGMDVNSEALKILGERMPNVQATTSLDSLPKGSFDFVSMVHCINQIDDLSDTLESVWILLRSGGKLVVVTHNPIHYRVMKSFVNLFNGYQPDRTMKREPTMGECAHLLYEEGFRVLEKERFGANIIPLLKYRYAIVAEKP